MPRRKHTKLINDRAWSSRANAHARDVGKDLVGHSPLPAERFTSRTERRAAG